MSALLQGVMHSVGNQINMSAADCFLCLGPSLTYPRLDPDLSACIARILISLWHERQQDIKCKHGVQKRS